MRSLRLAAASALVATLASVSSGALAEGPPPAAWPPPGVSPLPPPEASAAGAPAPAPATDTPAPAAPPAAPEPPQHGPRLPGVLLMVLGAAGLGTGAVFGIIATATGASVRSQCNGTVCPPSTAPDIARTKGFEATSYAALTAGGVIAAAGLVLTIVAPGKPGDAARLGPWIGRGSAGLGLSGSF